METVFETERLVLRKFNSGDADFIIKLLNTPGWLQNIGDRNIKSIEDARQYLLNVPIKSYAENGFGLWLVVLKDGNFPAGMCGLLRRPGMVHPEIGFAFLPEFNGKGYATEAAKGTLKFVKDFLKIKIIDAIVLSQNKASLRVLEKTGFKYLREIRLPDEDQPLLLFETDFNGKND